MREYVLPHLRQALSPNRSSRHGANVHLVVVHRPVGSYESSIAWLRNPSANASAHVITNSDREATQLVPWGEKAWACVAFNGVSDNIEVDDDAWNGHDYDALRCAARIVAFRLHKRNLPAHWSRHGKEPGFTRHLDLGLAGGGHSDPTQDIQVWQEFCSLVKRELKRGAFRRTWGI